MQAIVASRRPGHRNAAPLSAATRSRLLHDLLAKARSGDVVAAEALVRLSLQREGDLLATACQCHPSKAPP
jgi:hypothetical protein